MANKKEVKTGIDVEATMQAQEPEKLSDVPAVAQPTEVAVPRANVWGVENGVIPGVGHMSREDVVIPRIKLLQAMSDEASDATNPIAMGNIIRSDTKEIIRPVAETRPVFVIPLMMGKKRQLFKERKLHFVSHDMVNHAVDSPGGERPDGITKCVACPDAQWTTDEETGKPKGPACGQTFTYPVIVLSPEGEIEDLTPMLLDLGKLSTPAAKAINSAVEWSQKPLYSFIFALTTAREQRPKGVSFKWQARLHHRFADAASFDELDPRAQAAMMVFQRLQNLTIRTDEEAGGEEEDY